MTCIGAATRKRVLCISSPTVLGGHYPLFLEVDADEKEKCLRLFPPSNILLFRYQIILILKIIASYYEKFTPDCFVNMYDVIQLVICGIFTCKLELPEEGNDVLKAKRFSTKSAFL